MKRISLFIGIALIMASCGDNQKEYDATGTFEATEITVSAQATGELKSFTVNEGQNITEGTLLGAIDDYQLRQKLDELNTTDAQLEASKEQMRANRNANDSRQLDLQKQLASITQQIANCERERQRFAELVNDGAAPRKQLDDITYQIKVLQRQLDATRDQINSNNASLIGQSRGISAQMDGIEAQKSGLDAQRRSIDDQIANTRITAPITGTILEKYVEQGEFATMGKPLFKIANTEHMFIRAYVTSAQLKNIKVGKKVKVIADYGDNEKKIYTGTITWISNRSEFTPKTILTDDERADLVYAIKVRFKNDGYVKIGMYGEVKF
jgi:HlyD family secretion protein